MLSLPPNLPRYARVVEIESRLGEFALETIDEETPLEAASLKLEAVEAVEAVTIDIEAADEKSAVEVVPSPPSTIVVLRRPKYQGMGNNPQHSIVVALRK